MSEDQLHQNEEELIQKHRKEKKDLQAKITKMKKSIPKGDKKKNKEVKQEITELEKALLEKHKTELEELKIKTQEAQPEQTEYKTTIEEMSEEISSMSVITNCANDDNLNKPKISKAKRKRERKAAKLKERNEQNEIDAQEEYLNSARYKEEEEIKKMLSKENLHVKHMKSDGNCLYYAVQDQLNGSENDRPSIIHLREMTSDYILQHRDEFLPFLTKPDSGDCYTEDEFIHYCEDIKLTSAWGGQLELKALSHVLHRPIRVMQAHAPPVIVGEEFKNQEIILTYHRHQFGLGEHYNSVTTNIEESEPL